MGLGTAIGSGLLVALRGRRLFLVGFWIKLRQEESLSGEEFSGGIPCLPEARPGAGSLRVVTRYLAKRPTWMARLMTQTTEVGMYFRGDALHATCQGNRGERGHFLLSFQGWE